LYFLSHPERSRAEVRRDYPGLARAHAHRADQIIVPSQFTASDVQARLDIAPDRISVCPHGRPAWAPRTTVPAPGYVLFFGTLEPRKNVAGLLDAYERLLGPSRGGAAGPAPARHGVPELVLAGHAPEAARACLERIAQPPLQGTVRHIGYVDPARRRELYEGARLLVQPSFERLWPLLEAMTIGVPVVAAIAARCPRCSAMRDCSWIRTIRRWRPPSIGC
jgi:glycosyltransferase involved in cell wall biosynthesis